MNRVMMSQSSVGRLESMTGWPPILAWVNSSRENRSRQSHLRRPVCRRYTETSPCHLLRNLLVPLLALSSISGWTAVRHPASRSVRS